MKPLRIVLCNAGFDTRLESREQLLDRYWHVPKLAEALADLGHQVTVVQAFHRNGSMRRGNVAINFIATESAGASTWSEISAADKLQPLLESFRPQIVHLFGLTMLQLRRSLGEWCRKQGAILTASFHGGRPRRNPFGRWRQRQALAKTSAFFFPTANSAELWRSARLLPNDASVTLLPEVSSPFSGIDKDSARQALGIDGHPVLAWSGQLNPSKDPITALQGMERILRSWPNAKMLMAYQSTELLPEVRAYLAQRQALADNVKLLGELEHSLMETLFSAADFFVHTSHREWGSNALVESISCGAIPVVTNIPSLRALTRNIEPAVLFPVGDFDSLAEQLVNIPLDAIDRLSGQVRSAFAKNLSYPAMAKSYSPVFEGLVYQHGTSPLS